MRRLFPPVNVPMSGLVPHFEAIVEDYAWYIHCGSFEDTPDSFRSFVEGYLTMEMFRRRRRRLARRRAVASH